MTDLTREQLEALLDGSINDHLEYDHDTGEVYLLHQGVIAESVQPCDGPLLAAAPDLARQLLTTLDALAEARAAQAGVVERCAEELERVAHEHGRAECCGFGVGGYTSPPECCGDPDYVISARHGASVIRALADPTGVKLLAELRSERDAAIVSRNKWSGDCLDAIQSEHALRLRSEAAEAERDRLAAANAALEARLANGMKWCDLMDGPVSKSQFVNGQATAAQQIRAALAEVQADARREGGE